MKLGRAMDLTGQRFGRLQVVRFAGYDDRHLATWRCHCACGTTLTTSTSNLRSGRVQSCGCLRRELSAQRAQARKGKPQRSKALVVPPDALARTRRQEQKERDAVARLLQEGEARRHRIAQPFEMSPSWMEEAR